MDCLLPMMVLVAVALGVDDVGFDVEVTPLLGLVALDVEVAALGVVVDAYRHMGGHVNVSSTTEQA